MVIKSNFKIVALLSLFCALFFTTSTSYSWSIWGGDSKNDPQYGPASLIVSNEPFEVLPAIYKQNIKIKPGETISEIVGKFNLPTQKKREFVDAIKKVYSPKAFKVGQVLEFTLTLVDGKPSIRSLKFYKDNDFIVQVGKGVEGHFVATERPIEWKRQIVYSDGTILSGLYSDALKADVPQSVIAKLIEYFSFNVDFQRDIRGGDRFQIVYEKRTDESGRIQQAGDILYANLIMSGQANPIFRYELENGQVVYFNENGESFRRTLLKTPVDGSRISSGFSGMRKHPILGYKRGHKGIDFAVSSGTPIKSAGDGQIVRRETSSSYGNFVRVRHKNGYETLYAHMRAFNSKYRIGSMVKQGDIIGFVGCTGLCTGPHLHYEVIYQQRHINPQRLKQPPTLVLKGNDFRNYRKFVEGFMSDFKIKWQDDSYTVDTHISPPAQSNENT